MTPGEHDAAAVRAHETATLLYAAEQPWYVVAAHYAAMHLIKGHLGRQDHLPANMKHTTQHRSHWEDGRRISWGINDVVRSEMSEDVSRSFTSLVNGSHAIRYSAPFRVGDRLWATYQELRKALEQL